MRAGSTHRGEFFSRRRSAVYVLLKKPRLGRPLGFRIDAKTLRRAGLDYWRHLAWEAVDNYAALEQPLAGRRRWFFTKTAERLYTEVAYEPGDALVFGSESHGLPPSLLDANRDRTLRIPTRSDVRSLNLSCAVAVAAFEAVRQWGQGRNEGVIA